MFRKIKPRWIIISVVVALILVGIYLNHNTKTEKANTELQQIMAEMSSSSKEIKEKIAENETCFKDESLKEGKSAECVVSIVALQSSYKLAGKANVEVLEKYYQENQSTLDANTKQMIENNLKLYKSESYSALLVAYDKYFQAYINWHKYFRDYVGIKGLDNLTSAELMKVKPLAQDVVSTDEDLKLKTNAFSDYLHQNFSDEFISSLSKLGSQ